VFSRVRLRLTLVYLVAALALVVAVAGSAYGLLEHYFASTTDLALRYRMALELRALGLQPPADLAAAERAWFDSAATAGPLALPGRPAREAGRGGDRGGGDREGRRRGDDRFDSRLASLFVLRLDDAGALVPAAGAAGAPAAPLPPDGAAARSAAATGVDVRTVAAPDGRRFRLLTYAVPPAPPAGAAPGAVALVQIGRGVEDQEAILRQLSLALLALSTGSVVVLATASWFLAGWSLRPAQRAWERQRAFVANAGHELRGPLTLLRASVEVALRAAAPAPAPAPAAALPEGAGRPDGRDRPDDEQRALLRDALDECDHMARLVDDLLLLSRLDAGRLPLQPADVDVPALLADVGRRAGRLAAARGVTLDVAAGPAGGVSARCDPARLRQVLLILVDNALRHTPAGGRVSLEAARHGGRIRVGVGDTGAGIAPEHLPHVFDRFYRAGGTDRGADEGSGLGLAIARGLVEAQHGTIRLESRVGAGTRVEVTLPAATPPP